MNKKAIALLGIGAFVGTQVLHGYYDVMGRESRYKSLIGSLAARQPKGQPNYFKEFNESKLEWIKKQNTQKLEIISVTGKRLAGFLTCPKEKSNVYVLFAHGHHTDHNGDPANFLQYYVEKGYNFLAPDHISCGESEGLFTGFDYFEHQDCLKWIEYLINRFGKEIKIILHGVSMGGATVCQMADKVPHQVKLAVSDCPYTSALDEFEQVIKGVGINKSKALLTAFNALNKVLAGYDLKNTDVRNAVANSRVPMLFVHGNNDDLIPKSMSMELYALCSNSKDYLLIDGANHAEAIRIDEAAYHHKLDEFINKYLGE